MLISGLKKKKITLRGEMGNLSFQFSCSLAAESEMPVMLLFLIGPRDTLSN